MEWESLSFSPLPLIYLSLTWKKKKLKRKRELQYPTLHFLLLGLSSSLSDWLTDSILPSTRRKNPSSCIYLFTYPVFPYMLASSLSPLFWKRTRSQISRCEKGGAKNLLFFSFSFVFIQTVNSWEGMLNIWYIHFSLFKLSGFLSLSPPLSRGMVFSDFLYGQNRWFRIFFFYIGVSSLSIVPHHSTHSLV